MDANKISKNTQDAWLNIGNAKSDIILAQSEFEKFDYKNCCTWIDMAIVELMNAYSKLRDESGIQ
jgi:hypothetical protein